jgi:hypothetical protein
MGSRIEQILQHFSVKKMSAGMSSSALETVLRIYNMMAESESWQELPLAPPDRLVPFLYLLTRLGLIRD